MKFKIIIFLITISAVYNANAQSIRLNTDNTNAWLGYFGDFKFNKKWGIHLEAQWRRNDFVSKSMQEFFRPAINYYFNDNVFASVGYGFAETHPYGTFPAKCAFPESRIYEQLQLKQNINKVEWINRFRLEQRYSNLPIYDSATAKYIAGNAIYTNRFRLFDRFNFPIGINIGKTKPLYFYLADEFFINFGKNVGKNILDQNRLQAGLGYKLTKSTKIELGYMEQTVIKSDAIKVENNHTAILSLIQNASLFKKK